MSDTCPKCQRPLAQGLLIVPDPWTYCDDPIVCEVVALAYQRGLAAGRREGVALAKRTAESTTEYIGTGDCVPGPVDFTNTEEALRRIENTTCTDGGTGSSNV